MSLSCLFWSVIVTSLLIKTSIANLYSQHADCYHCSICKKYNILQIFVLEVQPGMMEDLYELLILKSVG